MRRLLERVFGTTPDVERDFSPLSNDGVTCGSGGSRGDGETGIRI